MINTTEQEKQLAAKEAVKLISNNQVIGLGTGSTAAYAIKEIGVLVKGGLQIKAVPTSDHTKEFALSLGIPVIDSNETDSIDITIDGADEFTTDLYLIKGGGGALFKEKIVASMTKREIIIADASKKVDLLGKFKLPVEVVPFAFKYVLHQLRKINGSGLLRSVSGKPFYTDQGNYIIDADFGLIADPVSLSATLNEIEGIVAHGLFIHLTDRVIMGNGDAVEIFQTTLV